MDNLRLGDNGSVELYAMIAGNGGPGYEQALYSLLSLACLKVLHVLNIVQLPDYHLSWSDPLNSHYIFPSHLIPARAPVMLFLSSSYSLNPTQLSASRSLIQLHPQRCPFLNLVAVDLPAALLVLEGFFSPLYKGPLTLQFSKSSTMTG